MTSRLVDGALARALYFWITLFKYKHMYDINREKMNHMRIAMFINQRMNMDR